MPIIVKLNLLLLIMQVLNQDETPLLYSLVFGEGVVNDAASVVLFNAIQSFDLTHINLRIAFQFIGNFFYLFFASTMLGVVVSFSLNLIILYNTNTRLFFFSFLFLNIQAINKLHNLFALQTGLLSAYIIKTLYFGRYVTFVINVIWIIY